MGIKELVAGAVVTTIIGGTAYTVNQADVVNNLANDTGLTQQQAEQYVNGLDEKDLASYSEVGASYVTDGEGVLSAASEIDCDNYEYEWQSASLSCIEGKSQLYKLGNDEVALGNAFTKLGSNSASTGDISSTVSLLSTVNSDLDFEIVSKIMTPDELTEAKTGNSYNKATLEAALQSN